jgi:tetratricopeptide (TPR) repeat protein
VEPELPNRSSDSVREAASAEGRPDGEPRSSALDKRELARVHNKRGFEKALIGEYDAAIALSDEAVQLDPQYASVFNNRGFAYLAKQQYDQALADFDVAIRLNPDLALPRQNRGIVLAVRGDHEAFASSTPRSYVILSWQVHTRIEARR